MLERAKAATRYERWTAVEYARFVDDLVILVDSHPRQQRLRQAVEKRLREELAKLQVEVNEEKSRKVDLEQGESFGFLGFEFRRVRSRRGRWMPLLLPKGKKRTELLGKLKEIFRSFRSQPVGGVIEMLVAVGECTTSAGHAAPGRELMIAGSGAQDSETGFE
jgi:RNA-directed DNA polymerase